MSRGGGVRRPSVSLPSPMENNPDITLSATPPLQTLSVTDSILVTSSSSNRQLPSAIDVLPASTTATINNNNSNNSNITTTTSTTINTSSAPPITQSHPNTPLPSSTSTGNANSQSWNASNITGPLTSQSVTTEGTEYPFPASPSEPSTPSYPRRPETYTASTASASSAPIRSTGLLHHLKGVLPTRHQRKLSGSKLRLSIPGFSKIRRGKASPPSPNKDSEPSQPLKRTTDSEELPVEKSDEMSSPGGGITPIFMRRMKGNNGAGETTIQPGVLIGRTEAFNQPLDSHHRQSLSASIPPVMLTPPEDETSTTWQPMSVLNRPTSQESSTLQSISPDGQANTASSAPAASGVDGVDYTADASLAQQASSLNKQTNILESVLFNGFDSQELWLKDALKVLLLLLPPDFRPATEAVRLISHSLPCPLPTAQAQSGPNHRMQADSTFLPEPDAASFAASTGYFMLPVGSSDHLENGRQSLDGHDDGTTSALSTITSAIQRVYGNATKRIYIHVSHAISSNPAAPRLQSSNLTGSSVNSAATSAGSIVPSAFLTSPPHEGGFFSSTIFNSIVMAQDPISYAASPTGFPLSLLQNPHPNPALPPFSLHFSLLERYIPPPTVAADAAMFSPYSSVLLDRVAELSPGGGSLIFIYPTKTGAKQFCDRYLGKVLDPLLRRLMVLHRLRDDLLWGISRMVAVEQMQEFDDLKSRLEHFCRRLSEKCKDETASGGKAFNEPSLLLPVSLVHAQKVNVSLNQLSWREWWTQQESQRIREVVKNHFSKAAGPQEPAPSPSPHQILNDTGDLEAPVMASSGLATAGQYSGPMDLAREILDGVKVLTTRPSSRGMGEAVFASSMVGKAPSWPVVGEFGGARHLGQRKHETESIEVGVFILRRQF